MILTGSPGFGDFTGFQLAGSTAPAAAPVPSQPPSLMGALIQQQQQQQQPSFADFGAFSSGQVRTVHVCIVHV